MEIFWANWEETLGQTQNSLEGLHILSDLQDKLENVAGERGVWNTLAATVTRNQMSRRR